MVDEGSLVVQRLGPAAAAPLRVTTTKRIRFARFFSGEQLALIMCALGYAEVVKELVFSCAALPGKKTHGDAVPGPGAGGGPGRGNRSPRDHGRRRPGGRRGEGLHRRVHGRRQGLVRDDQAGRVHRRRPREGPHGPVGQGRCATQRPPSTSAHAAQGRRPARAPPAPARPPARDGRADHGIAPERRRQGLRRAGIDAAGAVDRARVEGGIEARRRQLRRRRRGGRPRHAPRRSRPRAGSCWLRRCSTPRRSSPAASTSGMWSQPTPFSTSLPGATLALAGPFVSGHGAAPARAPDHARAVPARARRDRVQPQRRRHELPRRHVRGRGGGLRVGQASTASRVWIIVP